MKKQATDAKKTCLERLMLAGTKEQLANALAIENYQMYTRYDIIHRAR